MFKFDGVDITFNDKFEVVSLDYRGVHISKILHEGKVRYELFLYKNCRIYENIGDALKMVDDYFIKLEALGWSVIESKTIQLPNNDFAFLNLLGKIGDGFIVMVDGKKFGWLFDSQVYARENFNLFDAESVLQLRSVVSID